MRVLEAGQRRINLASGPDSLRTLQVGLVSRSVSQVAVQCRRQVGLTTAEVDRPQADGTVSYWAGPLSFSERWMS